MVWGAGGGSELTKRENEQQVVLGYSGFVSPASLVRGQLWAQPVTVLQDQEKKKE